MSLIRSWQSILTTTQKGPSSRLCSREKARAFTHSAPRESISESTKTRLAVFFFYISYTIVRVGGGYISIDEFLEKYTPAELEKLERKDPLKKFSEKVALQKTLVGKELGESSPIRGSDSQNGSPTRSQTSPLRSST